MRSNLARVSGFPTPNSRLCRPRRPQAHTRPLGTGGFGSTDKASQSAYVVRHVRHRDGGLGAGQPDGSDLKPHPGVLAGKNGLDLRSAMHLAYSATARAYIRPTLMFSQAIPVFALAPILTLWLGYGLLSKFAMAGLIIYFPITSAFFVGLMNTPKGYPDLAETMGANRIRVLLRIRMPSALPALASGLCLAAVYALIGEWGRSVARFGILDASGEREGKDRPYVRGADFSWLAGSRTLPDCGFAWKTAEL